MNTLPHEIIVSARRGWKLFPVKTGGKLPLIADWPGRASNDLEVLEAWAREYPGCNWGVATGQPSGFFVVDVDGAAGRASTAELERQGLTLPDSLTVTTGRADGGAHRYFRMPSGVDIHNDQSGRIGPHIDVRGTGGFVVCPPSVHASGTQYRFIDPDVAIADAPAWVIERLMARQAMPATTGQASPHTIGRGQRTPILVSLAGKLHSQGIPAGGILAALRGLNQTFNPPHDDTKLERIVGDLMRRYPAGTMPEEQQPDLVCLGTIAPRAVDWLWALYLALGMLSMLSGDPGAGKTFIALAIAAAFTMGRTPDGERCAPINVLYMSVENAPAEVIRPRFDSLGGDASRFHLLRGTVRTEDGESIQGAVSLSDVSVLDAALEKTRARLVIVDPIQSYLGATVDLHRSNETRPVLDGLAKLAEKHRCAILLLRHLSKANGGKAIHRGLGSIDLTGAVRSEMLAGSLPDDPEARALVHIKSNLGAYGPTLGYSIDHEGRFAWTGRSEITAGQMLEAPSNTEERSAVEDAREWLHDFLSDGSKEQPECRKKAEAAGISFATLRRAKDALRVRSFKATVRGAWLWALPDPPQGAHDVPQDAHTKQLSTLANLSTLEDAQKAQGAQASPLYSQDAQKSLCEQDGEHLGNADTKDTNTANSANSAALDAKAWLEAGKARAAQNLRRVEL